MRLLMKVGNHLIPPPPPEPLTIVEHQERRSLSGRSTVAVALGGHSDDHAAQLWHRLLVPDSKLFRFCFSPYPIPIRFQSSSMAPNRNPISTKEERVQRLGFVDLLQAQSRKGPPEIFARTDKNRIKT